MIPFLYPFGCQGQIPPNKWFVALIHWFTTPTVSMTGLMNIQGGHSGSYLSKWVDSSLPKIANWLFCTTCILISFWPFRDKHLFQQTLFIIVWRLICFALLFPFQLQGGFSQTAGINMSVNSYSYEIYVINCFSQRNIPYLCHWNSYSHFLPSAAKHSNDTCIVDWFLAKNWLNCTVNFLITCFSHLRRAVYFLVLF